ncbi:cis-aconitate decarboxylase-like [Physella acuta]|uniref:cis-aconitate decarboxylase-like n=1 Tax=Physella acuta TaxID=109671 RepID=UPI0027DACC5E|nr:cis-aconitate decarboxylase-like [Physella acuta]
MSISTTARPIVQVPGRLLGSNFVRTVYTQDNVSVRQEQPIATFQHKTFADNAHVPLQIETPTTLGVNLPATSVTSWMSDLVANTSLMQLSEKTIHRSKRMLLDTLGVGILGFQTDIAQSVTKMYAGLGKPCRDSSGSAVWGSRDLRTSPDIAAFINGTSVHTMDFDDTWHPATHPSGATLPALLALAQFLPAPLSPSLEDVLLAYNVGIQVQGMLLRTSKSARNLPCRFHPPSVVGVMGSAAACSNLLGFGLKKSRNALGIAASFAGAPMANVGTTTKPLHAGKAARFGLEAALLADQGIEGNSNILDMPSGFGAFYDDFDPEALLAEFTKHDHFYFHTQDIALKRYPAHLGMHWTIDAALEVHKKLAENVKPDDIKHVTISAPYARYVDRPLPSTMHEARHSFHFNACTALLDGHVTPCSYHDEQRSRPQLRDLMTKTLMKHADDNRPCFNEMYVEVKAELVDGTEIQARCLKPYGHWDNPLSDVDVVNKFLQNTSCLDQQRTQDIVLMVKDMDAEVKAAELAKLLHCS